MSVALFMSPGKCSFLRKVQCNQLKKSHPTGYPWKTRCLLENNHSDEKGGPENMAAGARDVGLAPTVT